MKDINTYQLEYNSCCEEIVSRSKNAYDSMLRTKTFYRLFIAYTVSLFIYSLYLYPTLTFVFLFVSYYLHHIGFMMYHSSLHAQFIELDHKQLLPGPFVAFVHHYVNPKLLCCWEHRATYQSFIFLISIGPIFGLSFLIAGDVIAPYVSTFLLWHLSASPIHEWYHVPPKDRRNYFNKIEYWILNLLEKSTLISTRKHINHHRHQINNKQDVVEFDDMKVGKPLSTLFNWLWQMSWHKLYRENKKNLTMFYTSLYLSALVVASAAAIFMTHCLLSLGIL